MESKIESKQRHINFSKLPLWISWLSVVVSVVFLCAISNRGLDLTDEGHYLLAAQYPHEVVAWPSAFHWYLNLLFRLAGEDIVTFRILGIFVNVTGGFWLGFGFKTFIRPLFSSQDRLLWIYPFMILGGMVYYTYAISTPSYNLINSFLINISFGCLFLALSWLVNDKNFVRYSWLLFVFLAGLALGFDFQNKFSSAISILSLYSFSILLISYARYRSVKQAGLAIVCILFGFVVGLILYFVIFESPQDWWVVFTRGIYIQTEFYQTEHSPTSRVIGMVLDLYTSLKQAVRDTGIAHVFLLGVNLAYMLYIRRNPNDERAQKLRHWFGLFCIFILGTIVLTTGAYFGGYAPVVGFVYLTAAHQFFIVLFLFLVHVSSWLVLEHRWAMKSAKSFYLNDFVLLVVLFVSWVAPFLGMLGSGNAISSGLKFVFAPWYVATAILVLFVTERYNLFRLRALGYALLCLMTVSQIISGEVLYPYGMNQGIFAQNTATKIGTANSDLLLDSHTANVITDMRQVAYANGFRAGGDILAFHNIPNIVFALGGKSLGFQWYTSHTTTALPATMQGLRYVDPEKIRYAFILRTLNSTDFFPDLSEFGAHFPDDYLLVGEWQLDHKWIGAPKIQMWKPKL